MSCRMKYAMKDGQIYHIDSVPTGLDCGCTCPSCGKQVVAKNLGSIREHHFSHYQSDECEYCNETQLHLSAKAIFEKLGSIVLPAVSYPYAEQYHRPSWQEGIVHVDLEQRLDDIIPDIIAETDIFNRYLVEIKVKHGVDDVKKEKIRELGISAIEIDISDMYETDIDECELQKALLDETRITWIYNHSIAIQEERRLDQERKAAYWGPFNKKVCPFCGSPLKRITGISSRGNYYDAIFCSRKYCNFRHWTNKEDVKRWS